MTGWWLVLAGCVADVGYSARVHDADGLEVGTPVEVSGVRVGEVSQLVVADGGVLVHFEVGREHDLGLHDEACVRIEPAVDGATLVVEPGLLGDFPGSKPLPACLTDERIEEIEAAIKGAVEAVETALPKARQIGEQIGEATREFTEGLEAGFEGE